MALRRLHAIVLSISACASATAGAIDASRSLRPMVHIPNKPEAKSSAANSEPSLPRTTADKAAKPAKPLPTPGTVDTNTASGKPFVSVPPKASCTVSAAAGDLEAQLRSCVGVASSKPAAH